MKLQHKVTGVRLWGRRDEAASGDLAKMIAQAERNHRRAVARVEALERRAQRPQRSGPKQRRDWEAERAELRVARQVVTDRLAELQQLSHLLQQAPAGGLRWSGRGSVARVPDKPRLP